MATAAVTVSAVLNLLQLDGPFRYAVAGAAAASFVIAYLARWRAEALLPRFGVVNAGKAVRSAWLQGVMASPKFYGATRWLPARGYHALRQVLKRVNARRLARDPLDPALRAQLASEFIDDGRRDRLLRETAADVRRLEGTIGRDLSRWLPAEHPS